MNTPGRDARHQLGISLIEALVALAVMAIGLLGIVGVQSTLRANSDVAKQRSEALRLAQKEVESLRAFTVLGSTGTSPPGYADITASAASAAGVSAEFQITRSVATLPAPLMGRTVKVQVGWTDRLNDGSQQVQLSTLIAGIAPDFAATTVVGGDSDQVGQAPKGRNRGIPLAAKDLGNGSSGFIPPGTTGVAWVFNNSTGLIRLCTTSITVTSGLTSTNVTCGTDYALLLSGYIHYSIAGAPSATTYDSLPTEAGNLDVIVHQTAPVALAGNVTCRTGNYDAVSRIYYCAIPVLNIGTTPPSWSGDLRFDYVSPFPSLAASYTSNLAGQRKVCRYHAAASYAGETRSLLNQNYLVIRAGNAPSTSVSYSCPSPDTQPHMPVPGP